jgi:hypothetical protein
VIVPVTRELLEARRRVARAHAAAPARRWRGGRAGREPRPPAGSRRAAALAALAALAMAVLAGLLLKVWLGGGVVTGSDGFLVADPLSTSTGRARRASTG